MNEKILKRIANLMSVKSIVTLVLTGVFATFGFQIRIKLAQFF